MLGVGEGEGMAFVRLAPVRPTVLLSARRFARASLRVTLAAVVLVSASLLASCAGGIEPGALGTLGAAPAPRPERAAAEAFARWDADRAAAWAAADPRALARLYAPDSASGRRDVAALRAWRARGLRIEGLRTQVLALRVLDAAPHRLRLRVESRVADTAQVRELAGGATVSRLPRDTAVVRVVVLRQVAGAWRAERVSEPRVR